MRIDPSRALGAYAAIMTLAAAWLGLTAIGRPATAFDAIDVQRINVREPDGTLRLVIASHSRMPGLVVGARDYPHPNRPEAGMIFYNDQGIENGGLVFDGRSRDGRVTNGGSLTFDRFRQDQTLQLVSTEDGSRRRAGLAIIDRPEGTMDVERALRLRDVPPGPDRDRALRSAGVGRAERAWLGRSEDGTVALVLGDAAGRPRLRLAVAPSGDPRIEALDANGQVSGRSSFGPSDLARPSVPR